MALALTFSPNQLPTNHRPFPPSSYPPFITATLSTHAHTAKVTSSSECLSAMIHGLNTVQIGWSITNWLDSEWRDRNQKETSGVKRLCFGTYHKNLFVYTLNKARQDALLSLTTRHCKEVKPATDSNVISHGSFVKPPSSYTILIVRRIETESTLMVY